MLVCTAMELRASSNSPLTRPSLLVRIRDLEDQEAWKEFVQIYTPLIYGHCHKQGLQEADAANVAQEVMSVAAQAMPHFHELIESADDTLEPAEF